MTVRFAVFRADASSSIGTGHVVRCRTLAAALTARGWQAALACRDLPEGLADSLVGAGVQLIPIASDMPVGVEPHAIAAAAERAITLVVADHYQLGAPWFDTMRDHADTLMAIDDLADRRQPVDLVLNQNLGIDAEQYDGLVPAGAQVLIGPRYALIRPEFAERRARSRVRDGRVRRILVFISGADPHDVTARAVMALTGIDASVDVVAGAAYPNLAALLARVRRRRRTQVHVNVDHMAELMDRADLAIGAPSSASWERCTVGLPTVLVALADNQLTVERELVAAGAALSAGWHATTTATSIRDIVAALCRDPRRVAEMSVAAGAVADGRGTERVVAAVEALVAMRMEAR